MLLHQESPVGSSLKVPKIVIWGGNGQDLELENIDSHASLSAYFLTRYLSEKFDVVNLVDMDAPEELLEHTDALALVSTFQRGFTSRIVGKDKQSLYRELRGKFTGKLLSIVDSLDSRKYVEDVLLFVRRPGWSTLLRARLASRNRSLRAVWMGWRADSEVCSPLEANENEIRIFVDHPPYSSDALDATPAYYEAFRAAVSEFPELKISVRHQHNDRIEDWYTEDATLNRSRYVRSAKIPWTTMVGAYRTTDIFCVTHEESAGLGTIEAAMCGARIYVPEKRFGRAFISRRLFADTVPYSAFKFSADVGQTSSRIRELFLDDIRRGLERAAVHKQVSRHHSWSEAAEIIGRELT